MLAAIDTSGYVNLYKLLPVVLVLLIWARVMTWIDKDTVAAHLPRELLNLTVFCTGLLGVALFFILPAFLPGYWFGLSAMLVMFVAGIGTYLEIRRQKVGLGDLKQEFTAWAAGMFKRKPKVKVAAGQVTLATKGGAVMQPPTSEEEDFLGYETVQTVLGGPLAKGAERIEIRPGDGASVVQFVVDGVAYPLGDNPTLEPATATAGISYLKKIAGLDIEDRRKPQTGMIKATLNGKRNEMEVSTAGTTAGETVRILVNPKGRNEFKLEALGLLPEQLAALQEVMRERPGIVLVAAPKAQGLTTMLYSILRGHDAYLNHILSVEHAPRESLEGITQNKLAINASATEEFKQVEWVCSQQSDILMADEIVNPASAAELVRFAVEHHRVYLGMRAGSTFDALMNWRRLVGDDTAAVGNLQAILCGRVLRRLCMACKIAYTPDPERLRKLNMDPAKVTTLYQARTEPMKDNKGRDIPCEFCHDLHYKGRFGVYELFIINDEVRQIVTSGGSLNQLRNAFRKQRHRYLQEVALAQVEAGETSVEEVLRVMRTGEAPTAPPAGQPPRRTGP
jgi:type II secretory ATPase GspE/PulE/Tfp pilus assembly ATPase PilB-like protein